MWKTVRLGEVCDFSGGSQPPKRDFVYEPQDGYVRLIQIRDFKSDKNICYVPAAKANKLCSEEDILIGRYGASVGKILRGLSGSYNVALMKARPDERILDKRWLHTYLTSPMFQKPLAEVSSRSAQNGFSKKDIYDFRLPLPPLAEQKRIVERLDKAFVEIDKAIATAEAKEGEVERLKASTLSAMLNSKDWSIAKLDEVAKPVGGSGFPKKYQNSKDGTIPFFKVRDMNTQGNEVKMSLAENYVTADILKEINARAYPAGTIIFPKIGGAIATNKKRVLVEPSAFDNNIMGLIPSGAILPEYLFKVFLSLDLYELSNKAHLPSITGSAIKGINLKLPPLSEQKRIVERLDKAFAEIEIVGDRTQSCVENYAALKASILKQELTPSEAV